MGKVGNLFKLKAGLQSSKFSLDRQYFFVLLSSHAQLMDSRQKIFSCPKKIFLSVSGPYFINFETNDSLGKLHSEFSLVKHVQN